MKSLELLLLFTFIIVLYLVISKKIPSQMIAGIAAIWFVMLWIGFDNMGAWDNSPINSLTTSLSNFVSRNTDTNKCKRNAIIKKIRENQYSDVCEPMKNNTIDEKQIEQKVQKVLNASKANTKKEQNDNSQSDNSQSDNSQSDNSQSDKQPLVYSEENYKYNLFDELGSLGDNKLAHKMKQMSNKNREAMDNFSRTYTKYANINYFEQELKDSAASCGWWDDDAHLSTKF
jgi:TATA-binding protein-associated factor Taf7